MEGGAINVAQWLQQLGLSRYASVFADNDIDGEVLLELTDADLETLGVTLGHRKKLRKAIATLQAEASARTAVEREPTDPQRRQLTVMFCDLVGSTALSEQLDPEDLRDIIRAYQAACKHAIERYEGYIARFVGDGVLTYFGYPKAHEEDAERAARAGLGVVAAMAQLNAGVGKEKGVELAVRIGIATGPVVVGDLIGEGSSAQRTAVGETTNLAARMQGLAGPNTVVIDDSTRQLLTHTFDFNDLGTHQLKGFREPQAVWQVLRPTRVEGRFEAQHSEHLTPLAGRKDEIDILLNRWRLAAKGQGQVVVLDGEPGVGKSRIVRALRERISDWAYVPILYQCSPFYANSPLYPILRHLELEADLESEETARGKLDKLTALLAQGNHDAEQVTPLFAELLSLPYEERFGPLEGSPEQRKEKTLDALIAQLEGVAEKQPVLAVFEDVHWIDPTSLDLLERVVARVAELQVLLIITSRPEFTSPWPRYSHLTVIPLSRLDAQHCLAMVQDIVGDDAMSHRLAEQIVQRTDGIPLFVEELTKTVLEAGVEEETKPNGSPAFAVPSTLQTSLLARLDRLGAAGWVARIGSAIGREFSYELLAEVASRPQSELENALGQLVDSGLVFAYGSPPRATYTFKHALVQDVAYDSLLHGRRPALHERIARVMEDRLSDGPAPVPELLAHHCSLGGLTEKAVHYWQLAGERAIERSANPEALSHLTHALELLPKLEHTAERDELELSLLITLGPVAIAVKGSAEAEEVYARAVALCSKLPESPTHFAAYWGQWRVSRTYSIKRERADKLLAVAENLGDPGLLLQAHHGQWASLFNLGFHRQCVEHVEHGVSLYDAGDFRWHASVYGGHDAAVCGHGEAALSLWLMGYPEQALAEIEEALVTGDAVSHSGSKAHAMDIALMLHRNRQDAVEVNALAKQMISFSEYEAFAVNRAKGEIFHGWARMRLGHVEQGLTDLRRGLEDLRALGTNEDLAVFIEMLAEGCAVTGQASQGLHELDAAFEEVERVALHYWDAELLRRKGELLLAAGDRESAGAEVCFEESLKVARRQEAKALELRTASSYARLLQNRGEGAAAYDLLAPVYEWFTEGFDSVDLKDARTQLHELQPQ